MEAGSQTLDQEQSASHGWHTGVTFHLQCSRSAEGGRLYRKERISCDTLSQSTAAEVLLTVRERIWRSLLIIAGLLGLAAVLIAAYSRMSEILQTQVLSLDPGQANTVVNLPLTISDLPAYPYPEPASYVDLQGGSVDLLVGAAILVLIIVLGVMYGQSSLK